MKNLIVTMPMHNEVYAFRYPVQGNSEIESNDEVIFGVNGVLGRILKPKEKVKLIFIVSRGGKDLGIENTKLFREEFDRVNGGKNLDVSENVVELNFNPVKGEFEKLTSSLIESIDEGAEIIGDFTFGSKPFPFVLLCAINFAEMFKQASLLYLTYSKVEMLDGPGKPPKNPMLYDLTSIYYLQKLIGAMEGRNHTTALKMLNDFFAMN